jgi:signal transduction histidine kinase
MIARTFKRILLLAVLMFPFLQEGSAQRHYADSLKVVLKGTSDPDKRVDLLCEIAYDLFDFDDAAAEGCANEALKLAEENNYQAGRKYALTIVALGNFSYGDYRKALKNLHASEKIVARQPPELTGYNLMLMGSTYRDLAYYDSAEFYYKKAIQTVGENGDPYYLGFFYRGLAHLKLIQWKNKEALEFLAKAETYANKKAGDYYVLMNIWDLYGRAYEQLLDFKKSDEYYLRMCKQEEVSKDYLQRIKCHMHESDLAIRKGELPQAMQSAFDALAVSDVYRYPLQRAEIYNKIGTIYSELSQYAMAIQYFLEGLKLSEKSGIQNETADLYARLAWVYKEEQNLDTAHLYLNKSEALRSAIGDQIGLSDCQNIRGLVYYLQKSYDKAMTEFKKSLTTRKAIGNELKQMAVISNMALVYEATGNYDLAIDLQKQSLVVEERMGSNIDKGISYNSLALLMIKTKRFKEATDYLNKAYRLSFEIDSKLMRRNAYLNYAKLYEATGDLTKAIQFHTRYESINDSIFSESSSTKLAEMQALYQVEKKEQEIRQLAVQRKTQQIEIDAQRVVTSEQRIVIFVSMISIVLLLFAGAVIYRYSRMKNRDNLRLQKLNMEISEQKEEIQAQSEELIEASETISNVNKELEQKVEARTSELKQAYKELDTFFYRSSHDFRRPITTFLGLAEVAKITVKDTGSLELFDKVRETAESLDRMLLKLQSISDVGAQQMVYKEVFLKELIEEVLNRFSDYLQLKKIAVRLSINENRTLVSYPAMIKIIIENLIENAIHFCGTENPFVHIKAMVHEDAATIEVEDNGQGIMDEYKSRIFEMYFRANEHSKGNGLGLYIARKAAEKLNGHIHFTSKQFAGSLFTVSLPNRKE